MANTLFSTVYKESVFNGYENFIVYTQDEKCLGNHVALSWAVATVLVFDVEVDTTDKKSDDTLKITLMLRSGEYADKIARVANQCGIVGFNDTYGCSVDALKDIAIA